MERGPYCKLCNTNFKAITISHLRNHGLNFKTYLELYPDAILTSEVTKEKRSASTLGHETSEETKKKISAAHKGKKLSEEHRKKISLIQKGIKKSEEFKQKLRDYNKVHPSPFKGKKHSDETKVIISTKSKGRVPWNKGKPILETTKEKIRNKLIKRKLSPETKIKMSLARKGKKMSIETKEKMRGRKVSIETREKIRQAQKGKKLSKEHLKKIFDSLNKNPNRLEKWAIDLFKESNLPLKFVGNFEDPQIFIGGKVPDFVATNSKKILVEVYNDYYKIKDYGSVENFKKQRGELFSRCGWKTLFFSEEELRKYPKRCVSNLKRELVE